MSANFERIIVYATISNKKIIKVSNSVQTV